MKRIVQRFGHSLFTDRIILMISLVWHYVLQTYFWALMANLMPRWFVFERKLQQNVQNGRGYESSNTTEIHEKYFTIFLCNIFSLHSQQLVIFEFWMNSQTNGRKNIFLKKKSFFSMFDNLKSIFADSLHLHIDFYTHTNIQLFFPVLFSFCCCFNFFPVRLFEQKFMSKWNALKWLFNIYILKVDSFI